MLRADSPTGGTLNRISYTACRGFFYYLWLSLKVEILPVPGMCISAFSSTAAEHAPMLERSGGNVAPSPFSFVKEKERERERESENSYYSSFCRSGKSDTPHAPGKKKRERDSAQGCALSKPSASKQDSAFDSREVFPMIMLLRTANGCETLTTQLSSVLLPILVLMKVNQSHPNNFHSPPKPP